MGLDIGTVAITVAHWALATIRIYQAAHFIRLYAGR